jgi:hypothetical protein
MTDADDDDMGAMWRAVKLARQEKRTNNRKSSAVLLKDAGIEFETKNINAHLIVKSNDKFIDFWPGTGLWMVRGDVARRYGVFNLIKFAREQE